MKKILVLLIAILICLVMSVGTAFAATSTVSRYTGKTYVQASQFDNCIVVNGIDVAAYQSSIDWNKVKADGVDFAIIRVGYRGYGAAGNIAKDSCFEKHISNAKNAGVMVGLYFYSQALTELEARVEATKSIEWLEELGYGPDDLELPIFMDYEYSPVSSGRFTSGKISKTQGTNNAKVFCQVVEEAGYKAGIYGSTSFLNKQLNTPSLANNYMIWDAQYYTKCELSGTYSMWQYSSGGKISGIGRTTDVNFWYLDPNPVAEIETTLSKSLTNANVYFTGNSTFTYNDGASYKPGVAVSYNGFPMTEGSDYKVNYVNNTQAGTGYAVVSGIKSNTGYQVLPFQINPSNDTAGIKVAAISDATYTGSEISPSVTLTDDTGMTLVAGEDYLVTYEDNVNVGTATVKINLIGNYTGTLSKSFNILPADQIVYINNMVKEVYPDAAVFNINASSSAAEFGSKLTYSSSNKNVATISEDGTIHIVAPGTTTIGVKASKTGNYNAASATFTLNVKYQVQTIKTGYTKYNKNENSGSFNIKPQSTGDGEISYVVDNPEVCRVIGSGRVVILGPGTATIKVIAGATSYYDMAETSCVVKVSPVEPETKKAVDDAVLTALSKTKITSVAATSEEGANTINWKKTSNTYGVDYFQVWKSVKKSSGYKKIAVTFNGKNRSYVDKEDLTPGKTYYYKVRGVRFVNNKAVYTPFTKCSVVAK